MRKWFTKAELYAKFGAENGQAIIDRKLADPVLASKEVRRHPELPDSEELQQYLVLDLDQESEEEEDILSQMYTVADKGSDSDSSDSSGNSSEKKPKKKQKNKKDKNKKAWGINTTIIHKYPMCAL